MISAGLRNYVEINETTVFPVFVSGSQDIVCEADSLEACPVNFTVRGSDDGESWVDVTMTQSDETGWHPLEGLENHWFLALDPRKPIVKLLAL